MVRQETKTIKIYKFEELNEKAKERAHEQFVAHEDFSFLEEDLTEFLKQKLQDYNINYNKDLQVYYSLSYSQGGGVCFIGSFNYKNYELTVKHAGHYYHYNSKDIEIKRDNNDLYPYNVIDEFDEIYIKICKELENGGYSIIEEQESLENFKELSGANDWEFLENGDLY